MSNKFGNPEFEYDDLHPGHEVWKLAQWWDGRDSELITDTDLDDAIEMVIDDCHPTPISELGTITIIGYAPYPDCPENELPEEGEPIREVCSVTVDSLKWTKKNCPHWLEVTMNRWLKAGDSNPDRRQRHLEETNKAMEEKAATGGGDMLWVGHPIRSLSKEALVGVAVHLSAKLREQYEGGQR